MICPNCVREINEDSSFCKFCGYKINGCNIIDFLKEYFQIFVIIGVFGALSLYLSNFAGLSEKNVILKFGSLLCLVIVILLSFELVIDIGPYLKSVNEVIVEKESYRFWIRNTWDILQLNLFRIFFVMLIILISYYLLFISEIGLSLLNVLFAIILLFMVIAGIYRPAISFVEARGKNPIAFYVIVLLFTILSLLFVYWILNNLLNPIVIVLVGTLILTLHVIYKSVKIFRQRIEV